MDFYTDQVTLFNKYTDPASGKVCWYRTFFPKAHLMETQRTNISTSGMKDADAVILNLKEYPKPYMEVKEWQSLEDKSQAFTIQSAEDFFVKGDVPEESAGGKYYEACRQRYDGVYKVTTFNRYTRIRPHLEIGGI